MLKHKYPRLYEPSPDEDEEDDVFDEPVTLIRHGLPTTTTLVMLVITALAVLFVALHAV